jgi:hypothetical protein
VLLGFGGDKRRAGLDHVDRQRPAGDGGDHQPILQKGEKVEQERNLFAAVPAMKKMNPSGCKFGVLDEGCDAKTKP